jgi:hypothetical protein
MARIELRLYESKQGEPRRVPSLLVDGERVPAAAMELDVDNQLPPYYDDPDERVRELAKNTAWGRLYRLTVNDEVLFETNEQPTRAMLDDGATAWRWNDVRLFFDPDPRLRVLKDITRDLFRRYPDARFGPGHVVLEDGNWGAYQQAIDFCHLVLAYRGLSALGLSTLAVFGHERFAIVYELDFYADNSTAEIAATLAALELIRWHEEGHKGDAPRK